MPPKPDVLVVGAGVSGLTTAVVLAELGFPVRVWARDLPPATTSCAAGALWGPYLVTDERIAAWAEETRLDLVKLAETGGTGVRLTYGHEAARTAVTPPGWARDLPGFRVSTEHELPAGFVTGWWYTAPVVDMPAYLTHLHDRLLEAGSAVRRRTIDSLREAADVAPVVINCTGFGAHDLVPDNALTPTRGQIVVTANPGIREFFAEHDESEAPVYILPQGPDRVVLGGSVEPGRTDTRSDPAIAADIHRRCAAVLPSLRHAPVLATRTGLRPTRQRVRVERSDEGATTVVHNYGHGGGGLTVSWGCARAAARLVEDAL